jgi:putative flippase GtrA
VEVGERRCEAAVASSGGEVSSLAASRAPVGRIIRSLAVSGITTSLSLTILAVLTRFDLTSPAVANVVATVAGIAPSFALNRRWAWHRTHRGHLTREVAPFWGYCLLALVLSTIAVARAAAWADAIDVRPGTRTAIILAANVTTFGALWVGQFLLLDKLLFRAPSVALELHDRPFGDVRRDALGAQGSVQRVVAVGEVVLGVGELGDDDEVVVPLADAEVMAEPVVADLGDRRR